MADQMRGLGQHFQGRACRQFARIALGIPDDQMNASRLR